MLFKRAKTQQLTDKIRNLVWPKMGWRRVLDYYKHRSIRIPDSEYSIALGLAFGCSISWTPAFGSHLLQSLLFCWLTKSNWIAAFLGTAFGNPWTTPALMLISYHVGHALFVATGYAHIVTPDDGLATFGDFLAHILSGEISWDQFTANFLEYFIPTLLGGYVMGLATFPLFYYPFYYMVKGARMARRARIERKIHKEAIDVTGQAK